MGAAEIFGVVFSLAFIGFIIYALIVSSKKKTDSTPSTPSTPSGVSTPSTPPSAPSTSTPSGAPSTSTPPSAPSAPGQTKPPDNSTGYKCLSREISDETACQWNTSSDGECTVGSTTGCGQEEAFADCNKWGRWIPKDYNSNPYTCAKQTQDSNKMCFKDEDCADGKICKHILAPLIAGIQRKPNEPGNCR
jgi:hypothetical protein